MKRRSTRQIQVGYASWCEQIQYQQICILLKSSTVLTAMQAYRRFSQCSKYPLHLRITEAGTLVSGAVKSSVDLGLLLSEGIGDTIRISLSAKLGEEIPVVYKLRRLLEVRE
jgi:(E)-4-hydroxy-3-methylbut-2-enyl-diphosphate synthase